MSDPGVGYRSREEIELWKERDPIPRIRAAVLHDFGETDEARAAVEEELKGIDDRVRREVEDAVAFAEAGEELPKDELLTDVYVDE
jgi:TPP-dependent pyruvate/acetoin dehydrogenase alpha subunit